MRNIWTIARREYDQYFISPIAYVVAVALLFILGGYFAFLLVYANQNFGFVPDVNVIKKTTRCSRRCGRVCQTRRTRNT